MKYVLEISEAILWTILMRLMYMLNTVYETLPFANSEPSIYGFLGLIAKRAICTIRRLSRVYPYKVCHIQWPSNYTHVWSVGYGATPNMVDRIRSSPKFGTRHPFVSCGLIISPPLHMESPYMVRSILPPNLLGTILYWRLSPNVVC